MTGAAATLLVSPAPPLALPHEHAVALSQNPLHFGGERELTTDPNLRTVLVSLSCDMMPVDLRTRPVV
ncbi:hypothetical protein BP5796_02919 [Coleophoma crateriformis]|uniref:Uncharacterized protein n=1 Tax=Coleophoma crateriformis TaxID=565419 RepID=A0A3D8SLL6_9HELO|nr:hypothetical protein BP5796_02919 [Coleophoma crateriformis]